MPPVRYKEMGKLSDYFDNKLSENEFPGMRERISLMQGDFEMEKEMSEIFDSISIDAPEEAIRAYGSVKSRLGFDGKRTRRSRGALVWTMRIAAGLLIPVAMTFGVLLYRYNNSSIEICEMTVPAGQTGELVLSDGTLLNINSGTRVTYPSEFRGKTRSIHVDGEILASVAKNPHKPFIIKSGAVDVKVLGTKFNFKSFGSDRCVELMLLEGSVQFGISSESQGNSFIMKPGDLVQYDKATGSVSMHKVRPDLFRSFNDGRALQFYNLTMKDIALDLERTFGTRIIITDEKLAEMRYYALFTNNESLEQILSSINTDNKMRIRKDKGVIFLSSK